MTVPLPSYAPPRASGPPFNVGINSDLILYVATDCRSFVSSPPSFVPDEPASYIGKVFACWPVVFPDGVRVIVEDKAQIKNRMEAECKLLQKLEKGGFPWSPRVLYRTLDDINPLDRPYIVHTRFPGKQLQRSDTFPAKKADREKILAQIARINFDLLFSRKLS
ncbi:uncharacterized protein N7473_010791 [Penicillium subrubescens]|nr:uncharacterized protein N7473_010791 [Penicillium subrubescens]KAJ5883905.1 hypothetical protein N7473_010791 [Penicillium subrubescens]